MAEAWLREHGVPPEEWSGTCVRHGENTPNGMWGSVVVELERRGDQWIVTALDRSRAPLDSDECGLRVLIKAEGRGQKAEG